jgi:two-component system NtrC family sensor kinase
MLIAHDLELKEIRLVKNIEAHLPPIQCDFMQIQQALLNVMSNASEAMTKGGTLSVKVMKSKEDGFIDVVIRDTGRGIPKEDLKNIFEPFFTTKEEGKGVGLGLSVAYGIITKHQGTIEVESKPGEGSAFTIRLPRA